MFIDCVVHDRAMFREFGFDPDQPPATIPEFDEVINALTIRNPKARLSVPLFARDPGCGTGRTDHSFGGHMYDAATDQAMVNSPA